MNYLESYKDYLIGSRKSPLTIKNYLHTIARYLFFLKRKGREPDGSNVEEFLLYLGFKGCGARSLDRHRAALKSFFKNMLKREKAKRLFMSQGIRGLSQVEKERLDR